MFVDRRYRNFIIDMDGVIYRGNTPLPHSAEFINFLREIDAKVVFFSNNSTLSRKQYVEKLSNMGIKAREEEIVSSGLITAYCLSKENPGASLYVIGERRVAGRAWSTRNESGGSSSLSGRWSGGGDGPPV